MARVGSLVLITLAGVIGALDAAGAQTPAGCDASALGGSHSLTARYAIRADGKYCDGLVFHPDSGRLELVSVFSGAEPSALPITVRVATDSMGSAATDAEIRLHASTQDARGSYRLDAVLRRSAPSLSIGNESAMQVLGLAPRTLGWLAWYPLTGKATYLPVSFDGSGNAATIVVMVRPAYHATSLQYRVQVDDRIILTDVADTDVDAGELVTVRIPIGEPQLIDVVIWSTSPAGDVETLPLRLARPLRRAQ